MREAFSLGVGKGLCNFFLKDFGVCSAPLHTKLTYQLEVRSSKNPFSSPGLDASRVDPGFLCFREFVLFLAGSVDF